MEARERYVGMWLTTSVPFVEYTKFSWPTDSSRDQVEGWTFFFDCHNDDFFGLACANAKFPKTKSNGWTYPSLAKNRENARMINKLNDYIKWN